MRIRRASVEDLDAVFEINFRSATAGFRHIFGDEPFPTERVRERFQRILESGEHEALLAERSGEPVGFVVVSAGILEALYVVPDAWSTGVGTQLADEGEALLRAGEATLWVLRDNARGRRFWERRAGVRTALRWRPSAKSSSAIESGSSNTVLLGQRLERRVVKRDPVAP